MIALEPYIKNKSVIIWDWNGTLLNDLEIVHETLCDLLRENELPEVCVDTHRRLFKFPIREYYDELGFDFAKTPYEDLAERYLEVHNPRMDRAKLFDGVEDFLRTTKENGISHFILSVAHEDDLHKQVRDRDIHHYFEALCGLGDLLAISKLERGKRLMRDHQLDPAEVLFIGDTDHDLEVGKTLGVDTLLIAEGHQSYERLSDVHHQVLKSRT